jgi:hypothetical protein
MSTDTQQTDEASYRLDELLIRVAYDPELYRSFQTLTTLKQRDPTLGFEQAIAMIPNPSPYLREAFNELREISALADAAAATGEIVEPSIAKDLA